jgi:lipopolysaccharide biosynthesis glycosyltransferase
MSTPSSLKKPTAMQSFEQFKKQAKQKEERVRFQSLFVSIVEFRWLELKGTVNICLSYQKFEPPNFINFREKKVWF